MTASEVSSEPPSSHLMMILMFLLINSEPDIQEPVTPNVSATSPTVDESQIRESIMVDLKSNFDDLMGAITNLREAR